MGTFAAFIKSEAKDLDMSRYLLAGPFEKVNGGSGSAPKPPVERHRGLTRGERERERETLQPAAKLRQWRPVAPSDKQRFDIL